MNAILKKLYSNSNRLALMCDSLMICISIFQFNYNIVWFQVCILILSIFHILLIFFQDQHLNSTLIELQTQNNFANINIEKLNKENGTANFNIQTLTFQLSNLLIQNNLSQSNIKELRKYNKIIYHILAKELYTQFENSPYYNSMYIGLFTKLINVKDPNEKLSFEFDRFNFINEPAFNVVNALLYNLGPCGNI